MGNPSGRGPGGQPSNSTSTRPTVGPGPDSSWEPADDTRREFTPASPARAAVSDVTKDRAPGPVRAAVSAIAIPGGVGSETLDALGAGDQGHDVHVLRTSPRDQPRSDSRQ